MSPSGSALADYHERTKPELEPIVLARDVRSAERHQARRDAQLAGGIGGGRTYLAACALGLGATGLTFFDDEVTRLFSPSAQGKAALFLMAVGRRGRRRRTP